MQELAARRNHNAVLSAISEFFDQAGRYALAGGKDQPRAGVELKRIFERRLRPPGDSVEPIRRAPPSRTGEQSVAVRLL